MSDEERLEIAKKYVDQQLETMQKFGSRPKEMSPQEYESLIHQVAKTVHNR
jgi:hypothetical protein